MTYLYRKATPEDVNTCITVRGKTRENALSIDELKEIGVTVETWKKGIREESLPGYVCLSEGEVIGYCFGVAETGEIAVLALLPKHEDRGIGKKLLGMMVQHLKNNGFNRVFLGCTKDCTTRSYGFYRYLGWKSTGVVDAHDDEILELIVK